LGLRKVSHANLYSHWYFCGNICILHIDAILILKCDYRLGYVFVLFIENHGRGIIAIRQSSKNVSIFAIAKMAELSRPIRHSSNLSQKSIENGNDTPPRTCNTMWQKRESYSVRLVNHRI
jgi:hypothetical protein